MEGWVGVLQVEFTARPYTTTWNTGLGLHSLRARAFNAAGNSVLSEDVVFTLDGTPPTVFMSGPNNGSTVSGITSLTSNAQDNTWVSTVDYYRDSGSQFAKAVYGGQQLFWDSSTIEDGTHTIYAVATDAAGNTGTSPTITINVDNIPPELSVNIDAPINNSTVKHARTTRIQATVVTEFSVTVVEFYVNGELTCKQKKGAGNSYSCDWRVPPRIGIRHNLVAKAYDSNGSVATSVTVTVTSN